MSWPCVSIIAPFQVVAAPSAELLQSCTGSLIVALLHAIAAAAVAIAAPTSGVTVAAIAPTIAPISCSLLLGFPIDTVAAPLHVALALAHGTFWISLAVVASTPPTLSWSQAFSELARHLTACLR
jgi:hypothetical protein